MPGELRFGRPPRQVPAGTNRTVLALLVGCGILALLRPSLSPRMPDGVPIEVQGDIPRPGLHLVVDPTVARAVAAAGGGPVDDPRALKAGDRVEVTAGGIQVSPASDPLLIGLPIDLNAADVHALTAVPGVGESMASAIVADRQARGPFRRMVDLRRVEGVGPEALERLAPFVTLGDPPLLDLDTATVAELEALPGIGPVLAARIVVDRADRGPFRSVDELSRVQGIHPALIEQLRGSVRVGGR